MASAVNKHAAWSNKFMSQIAINNDNKVNKMTELNSEPALIGENIVINDISTEQLAGYLPKDQSETSMFTVADVVEEMQLEMEDGSENKFRSLNRTMDSIALGKIHESNSMASTIQSSQSSYKIGRFLAEKLAEDASELVLFHERRLNRTRQQRYSLVQLLKQGLSNEPQKFKVSLDGNGNTMEDNSLLEGKFCASMRSKPKSMYEFSSHHVDADFSFTSKPISCELKVDR